LKQADGSEMMSVVEIDPREALRENQPYGFDLRWELELSD